MRVEPVDEYKLTLRRLAMRDDRYIDTLLSEDRANATLAGIDPRSHALARIAALIALDAAPPSYMSAVEAGLEAGASYEEIVGTLIAVMPIVGVARIVSAAPNLGLALGYDVAEALETEGVAQPGDRVPISRRRGPRCATSGERTPATATFWPYQLLSAAGPKTMSGEGHSAVICAPAMRGVSGVEGSQRPEVILQRL